MLELGAKVNNTPQTALVFTKIDKIDGHNTDFQQMMKDLHHMSQIDKCFYVSGLRGTGLDDLQKYMLACSDVSPWIIDDKEHQEAYNALAVKEIIREKIFRAYYKEIPYALSIHGVETRESSDGIEVRADIQVPSSSIKTIVVGRKGTAIASVERAVSRELEKLHKGKLGRAVLSVIVMR